MIWSWIPELLPKPTTPADAPATGPARKGDEEKCTQLEDKKQQETNKLIFHGLARR
jgi:hypothetical protein